MSWRSVVCFCVLCVFLSVNHACEHSENGWTNQNATWSIDKWGNKKQCIKWGMDHPQKGALGYSYRCSMVFPQCSIAPLLTGCYHTKFSPTRNLPLPAMWPVHKLHWAVLLATSYGSKVNATCELKMWQLQSRHTQVPKAYKLLDNDWCVINFMVSSLKIKCSNTGSS